MLIDAYGRKIDYLRISVTDRCNLRCIYCMTAKGILHKPQKEILLFEEIFKIVSVFAKLGIKKIRITGGEPLVRKDLHLLIKKLRSIEKLKEICLTTNGIYLSDYAYPLKIAGLDRVNISLDTLVLEKFKNITRDGNLERVLKGIESAFLVGLTPVKINIVLIKRFNDDEILNFAKLTKDKPIHVRFIEYMPTNLSYIPWKNSFFSAIKAKNICDRLGKLNPVENASDGVAKVFRIEDFCGTIGFISAITEPFCSSCNKLRLTADGRLKSCLYSSKMIELKGILKKGTEHDLTKLIKEVVILKLKAHSLLKSPVISEIESFSMCQIGG
ncbi:MAG: GTP 3',8-cyclase MoaA [Candidatus Firestonebacteria bacterium]